MRPDVDYLSRLHDAVLPAMLELRSESDSRRLFTLVLFYSSLIEFTHCVVVLSRSHGHAGLSPVVRTMLETYVEFLNLAADDGYLRTIDAMDLRQGLSVIKVSGDQGPYSDALEGIDVDMEIERLESALLVLKAEGATPLDIKERFTRAGMREIYDLVYGILCADVHSNRSVVEQRHIYREGDALGINLYAEPSSNDMGMYCDITAGVLRESTCIIHGLFESPALAELMPLIDEVQVARISRLAVPNKRINPTR